jgi:hypothetical protein
MKEVVTSTVTIPAQHPARSLSITSDTPVPNTDPPAPAQKAVAQENPTPLRPIQYAAAVLKGPHHTLEWLAPCFVSDDARIKKCEEDWILESSEFALCTTGEQVFPIADDIVSRVHSILSLYCGATSSIFSVEHIYWINSKGEPLRSIRGSIVHDILSSNGAAELKTLIDTRPLASAVFQTMIVDSAVNEALSLHGESGLSWSQVYDIIEFLGGEAGIEEYGYAKRKDTRNVRRTANHYRHLGSKKTPRYHQNRPRWLERVNLPAIS